MSVISVSSRPRHHFLAPLSLCLSARSPARSERWKVRPVRVTCRRGGWTGEAITERSNFEATANPALNPRVYSSARMAVPRVVTADDLRSRLGHELDVLRSSEDVLFVSKRGRLTAVLIDVERYRELVERVEYLEDSLAALQAREEVDQAVPWSKVRK